MIGNDEDMARIMQIATANRTAEQAVNVAAEAVVAMSFGLAVDRAGGIRKLREIAGRLLKTAQTMEDRSPEEARPS